MRVVGGVQKCIRVNFLQKADAARKNKMVHNVPFHDLESFAHAAKDAINFLRANHCSPTDDGMRLSAEQGKEMFAVGGELAGWAARDCTDEEAPSLVAPGCDDDDDGDGGEEDDDSQDS